MASMRKAIAATIPDAGLREDLDAAFAKLADRMRNEASNKS